MGETQNIPLRGRWSPLVAKLEEGGEPLVVESEETARRLQGTARARKRLVYRKRGDGKYEIWCVKDWKKVVEATDSKEG